MVAIVFMVAGMSSRFKNGPKQFAKVGPNNKSLIEYSVNQALKNGKFNKIYFITNFKTEYLFRNIFGDSYDGHNVIYIEQKYDKIKRIRPWGTTDALCSLIGIIDESFILLNGDQIYGEGTFKIGFNMMKENKTNLIGGVRFLKSVPLEGKVNRGIIEVENNKIQSIKEYLGISQELNPELKEKICNVNFIGLQLDVLEKLNKILLKFKEENYKDSKIECLLPDNLNELIQKREIKMDYFEITEEVLEITNPSDEKFVRDKLN